MKLTHQADRSRRRQHFSEISLFLLVLQLRSESAVNFAFFLPAKWICLEANCRRGEQIPQVLQKISLFKKLAYFVGCESWLGSQHAFGECFMHTGKCCSHSGNRSKCYMHHGKCCSPNRRPLIKLVSISQIESPS